MMGVVPCGARPGTTTIRTIFAATTATTTTIHRIATTTSVFGCCCLAERLAEMSPAGPAGPAVGQRECRCHRDAGSVHQTGPLVCPVPLTASPCVRRGAGRRRGGAAGLVPATLSGLSLGLSPGNVPRPFSPRRPQAACRLLASEGGGILAAVLESQRTACPLFDAGRGDSDT